MNLQFGNVQRPVLANWRQMLLHLRCQNEVSNENGGEKEYRFPEEDIVPEMDRDTEGGGSEQ